MFLLARVLQNSEKVTLVLRQNQLWSLRTARDQLHLRKEGTMIGGLLKARNTMTNQPFWTRLTSVSLWWKHMETAILSLFLETGFRMILNLILTFTCCLIINFRKIKLFQLWNVCESVCRLPPLAEEEGNDGAERKKGAHRDRGVKMMDLFLCIFILQR